MTEPKKAPAKKAPVKKPAAKTTKAEVKKSRSVKRSPIISYPDSWEIEETDSASFLVFYKEDSPIMKLELNPESVAPLLEELNNRFILPSEIADSWTYRSPKEGDQDFLTIFREGKTLGTLPIDNTLGVKLWLQMSKFKPKVEVKEGLTVWAKKHKIKAFLSLVILVIGLGYPLVSMIIDFIEGYI